VQDLENIKQTILANGNLPEHVAIIMDGNGRWAKSMGKQRVSGHREGVNSVRIITELAGELGLKVLTLYTFSSENWKRPRLEVSALMNLLLDTINREVEDLDRNNVRLSIIGHLEDLPAGPRRGMQKAIDRLQKNTGLILNLALSYGSRQEIKSAVQVIAEKVKQGELQPGDITDDTISSAMFTSNLPDPDLLIRTSGEFRLSNFLLWQLAYTEIYVSPVFWPAFREKEFLEAILNYQQRERRFGRVSEQIKH